MEKRLSFDLLEGNPVSGNNLCEEKALENVFGVDGEDVEELLQEEDVQTDSMLEKEIRPIFSPRDQVKAKAEAQRACKVSEREIIQVWPQ